MSRSGLATRLYRGEAGLNIVSRRKLWFSIAAVLVLIAVASFAVRGFSLGIEFRGGNAFQIPARVGTLNQVEDAVTEALSAIEGEEAEIASTQQVGGAGGHYEVRTAELSPEDSDQVRTALAERFGVTAEEISISRVSGAWGDQVTERALLGLLIFLALVTVYLVVRFEWRMAVAAVSALLLDLVLTAGVYSLVGFEVTPSTIIGFLTILGFALYDVVVVFDKVQENTRTITASATQTYGEAANLAINQTLMRSINTSVVSLLPVGGLLFIGAGLLGAGTLKDLGLVLFVGMGAAFFSSIFFATPMLVTMKESEPRIRAHTQRVRARRTAPGEATPAKAKGVERPQPVELSDPEPQTVVRAGGRRGTAGRKRPSGARRR